jgi:hypothetical protein
MVLVAAWSRNYEEATGSSMKKQTRITKKRQTAKPGSTSPFEKYRGIGSGQIGFGRKGDPGTARQVKSPVVYL